MMGTVALTSCIAETRTAWTEVFGQHLTADGYDRIATVEALEGSDYVVVYFGALWCAPCLGFVPLLSQFCHEHGATKKLKVVFSSGDPDEAQFLEYMAKGISWKLAAPFDPEAHRALCERFSVQGMPTATLLDKSGSVILKDVRQLIERDPRAELFPWRPVPTRELVWPAQVVGRDGSRDTVGAIASRVEMLGLYFGAHSRARSREFTTTLARWYEEHCVPGKDLHGQVDIISCSSDRSFEQYDEQLACTPWKAILFESTSLRSELADRFGVESVPALVFIDCKTAEIIIRDGCSKIVEDPERYPWVESPWLPLREACDFLDEAPLCVLFLDCVTAAAEEAAAVEAFATVAAEYCIGGRCSARMRFAIASTDDEKEVVDIRSMLGRSHTRDKPGPTAARVTILDFRKRRKALLRDGRLGSIDAVDLGCFVKAYVAGSCRLLPLKEH